MIYEFNKTLFMLIYVRNKTLNGFQTVLLISIINIQRALLSMGDMMSYGFPKGLHFDVNDHRRRCKQRDFIHFEIPLNEKMNGFPKVLPATFPKVFQGQNALFAGLPGVNRFQCAFVCSCTMIRCK